LNIFNFFLRFLRYTDLLHIRMRTPKISLDIKPKLSGTEIANHYGVDAATVRRWRREGMPAIWYNPKLVRYELSKVDEWLRARGSQPRPAIVPPHERKKANQGEMITT
jgi:hypothetical protein